MGVGSGVGIETTLLAKTLRKVLTNQPPTNLLLSLLYPHIYECPMWGTISFFCTPFRLLQAVGIALLEHSDRSQRIISYKALSPSI